MRIAFSALLGLCLAAAPALGQAAFRVKDIRTTGTGGTDTWPWAPDFVAIGATTYFNVGDGVHGMELWASDGTAAGTHLVKDICPGICSGAPRGLTVVGSTLYFAADDGTHGVELWKSDGTAAGTALVADLTPGLGASVPHFLAELGGKLLFSATTPATGFELWTSDGTAAGTTLLADIEPGAGESTPEYFGRIGALTFWSADDTAHGRELWVSDGTPAGTRRVTDLAAGPADSISGFGTPNFPGRASVAVFGSRLFFRADDGTAGTELWASDGTPAGTVRIKDIAAGTEGSFPFALCAVGSTLFFSAFEPATGRELWKTDGTEAGTVMVKEISPGALASASPIDLTAVGGVLFFRASDDTHGRELWKSDGTEAGTVLVKDIRPGSGVTSADFLVTGDRALGSLLLFYADDGTHGYELWKSDGTEAGTTLLADLSPGPAGSYFQLSFPAVAGGRLYFQAFTPADGAEVYTSDGTAAGTGLLQEINTQASAFPILWTGDLFAVPFADRAGALVFSADDGTSGLEPWTSDGTAAGTSLIADLNPGTADSAPTGLAALGTSVLMNAEVGLSGRELYATDGTAAGTRLLQDFDPANGGSGDPQELTPWAGQVYFEAPRPGNPGAGFELWKSDGTPAGTVPVIDPFPTNGPRPSGSLVPMGSRLFFTASTPAAGAELWASDGTAAGTVAVLDLRPGTGSGFPQGLAATANRLFFSADDGTTGREPWVSDGTAAGTLRLKDIAPGSAGGFVGDDGFPDGAMAVTAGGLYFFVANDGTSGEELWASDGTPAGTVRVKDIRPGASGSEPRWLTAVGRKVFFVADDGTAGRELWVSDGTAPGTLRLGDLAPGAESSAPQQLTAAGGQLLFSAHDPAHGRELWRSGGTPATTVRLTDLAPGPLPASPLRMTASGAYVYFAATDGTTGFELYALPKAALGTAFYTVAPCRAVDTRSGSPLQSGISRTFAVAGSCGIPATAQAVAVNLTAVAPQGGGFLTAYPAGTPTPPTSTLNLKTGRTLANNATLPLGGGGLDVVTSVGGGGQVHLLIDVVGYYQ